MSHGHNPSWEQFQKSYFAFQSLGLRTDLSRMGIEEGFFDRMAPRVEKALAEMDALEAGSIANPDENRMVGHYWLRNAELAPTAEIRGEIQTTLARIKDFARAVHSGAIQGQTGHFKNFLLIGIGGSSLGPQFVANALGNPKKDPIKPYFFDNTDSDGMERVLATIGDDLGRTLCIVVSKSGDTPETRNGMIRASHAYGAAGLIFEKHAVAITRRSSNLDKMARSGSWLDVFPMWDWVGGRTSELSAVGLLPASLQGFDVDSMLAAAKACDDVTRSRRVDDNPAMQLALAWYHACSGIGRKVMVVLPYRDRLELISKYLQQLIMESLGKTHDHQRHSVFQGLTVLGNKGSTDQHSYVQQLVDGSDSAFVVFIDGLSVAHELDRQRDLEASLSADDHLCAFLLGTRRALFKQHRTSVSIIIDTVSASAIGTLIALFERTVGFYASLVNINAYHQPGVESGKKAAKDLLDLQCGIMGLLNQGNHSGMTVDAMASALNQSLEREHIFRICERLVLAGRLRSIGNDQLNLFSKRYFV